MVGAFGFPSWDSCNFLAEEEVRGGHQQSQYAKTYERLLVILPEQLTGNSVSFMEYWAGGKLVQRPNGNVLQVI